MIIHLFIFATKLLNCLNNSKKIYLNVLEKTTIRSFIWQIMFYWIIYDFSIAKIKKFSVTKNNRSIRNFVLLLIDLSNFVQHGNPFITRVRTVKNIMIDILDVIITTAKRIENILEFTLDYITKEVVEAKVLPCYWPDTF